MATHTMDSLLDVMNDARQRVTYGAVAALIGASPRTVMAGCARDQRHSWIVGRRSGLPTGYTDEQLHPELLRSDRVIETREELEGWLATQPALATADA